MSGPEIVQLTRDALSPHEGRDVRELTSTDSAVLITDDEGQVWVLRAVLALAIPQEEAAA